MRWTDDAIAFFSGALSGGGSGLLILNIPWMELIWQGPIKIFFAIIIAFCGGIAGVLGKDFYQHKIKNKVFKNKIP